MFGEMSGRSERRAHQRLDGVRHPEGHEAVAAVAGDVVRLVEEAKGGARLEDARRAEGLVEATHAGFDAWQGENTFTVRESPDGNILKGQCGRFGGL